MLLRMQQLQQLQQNSPKLSGPTQTAVPGIGMPGSSFSGPGGGGVPGAGGLTGLSFAGPGGGGVPGNGMPSSTFAGPGGGVPKSGLLGGSYSGFSQTFGGFRSGGQSTTVPTGANTNNSYSGPVSGNA